MVKILVLAAGDPISDPTRGEYPLFLSEVDGSLLIERLIRAYQSLGPCQFIFAVRKHDVATHHIDDILRLIVPDCGLIEIGRDTQGAACTALLAVDQIDAADELIVTNATDYIDVDLKQVVQGFRESGADAGTITFESLHPRYSFVRTDAQGLVMEAAEKRPISRQATTGFFWFARGADFIASLQSMIGKDVQVNGRYYICPALNEMILNQKRIMTRQIPPDHYHPFKSPQQVNTFESLLEYMRANHEAATP